MAQRMDRANHPGTIHGYVKPPEGSGLDWFKSGGRTRDGFKFPALDAMKRMQAKDEKKPPNEVTDDILKQMLELWRGALGTS